MRTISLRSAQSLDDEFEFMESHMPKKEREMAEMEEQQRMEKEMAMKMEEAVIMRMEAEGLSREETLDMMQHEQMQAGMGMDMGMDKQIPTNPDTPTNVGGQGPNDETPFFMREMPPGLTDEEAMWWQQQQRQYLEAMYSASLKEGGIDLETSDGCEEAKYYDEGTPMKGVDRNHDSNGLGDTKVSCDRKCDRRVRSD
tara:strand:- start:121 stop:714 length:594 start_codon:yes stop_codon:yes gene_type:complete